MLIHDSMESLCALETIFSNKCTVTLTFKPNKGPKGPHIVHMSTMCHLCWRIGRSQNTELLEDILRALASCKVLSNSVHRFQRWSWKRLSKSEARAAIFVLRSAKKTYKLGIRHWDFASYQVSLYIILLSVAVFWSAQKQKLGIGQFHRSPFSGCRGEVENVSVNI